MSAVALRAPLARGWWPAVARIALELARGAGLPARDLRGLTVIVPALAHAPLLRAALHQQLEGAAFIAPRCVTTERWAGVEGADLARRAELYGALRASAWARAAFGSQPAALWALARDVADLGDELTLAAAADAGAFEGRLRDAVRARFERRAARAADAQAQLVLSLWRAGAGRDAGATRLLSRLAVRAAQAEGPWLLLAPLGARPWQRALADACARHRPACLVEGDAATLAHEQPWMAAVWPELLEAQAGDTGPPVAAEPIERRAQRLRAAAAPSLAVLRTTTLEAEAAAAADWVLQRLQAGDRSVALVALDRAAARRVRALLERAQVLVADEAGWKLSTTSAAAAVMRWFDLASGDFDHHDLLDLLKSPFTLADAAIAGGSPADAKAGVVAAIELALRREDVNAGAYAVRAAVAGASATPAALACIDRLLELARRWREPGRPAHFAALLDTTIDALGMRSALARDPYGRIVLRETRALADELGGTELRLSPAEFRALLAARLEEAGAVDPGIASAVRMVSLAGTRLRRFDAALLIGADADHLPAAGAGGGLLSHAVRRDLGLPTRADARREQLLDLAALLAQGGTVAATWRAQRDDEPVALSPWLDRVRVLSSIAGLADPVHAPAPAWHTAPALAIARPAPRARAGMLTRLSASGCQSLVDCPYQFFARHLLALRELDPIRAVADKRDFGQAMHDILCRFHRAWGDADFAAQDLQALLRDLAAHSGQVFDAWLARQPGLFAYRQRWLALLPGYAQWLQAHARDGWRWSQAEASFTETWQLADGARIDLVGRVDRIDTRADGSVLLLDYKARAARDMQRALAQPGEDIQLYFYGMLLASQPVEQAAYLCFERAAVAGRSAAGEAVTRVDAAAPLAGWVDAITARLRRDLQRIGAGAPLPALGVEASCARCEMRGLCRRGFWQHEPGAAAAGGGGGL